MFDEHVKFCGCFSFEMHEMDFQIESNGCWFGKFFNDVKYLQISIQLIDTLNGH